MSSHDPRGLQTGDRMWSMPEKGDRVQMDGQLLIVTDVRTDSTGAVQITMTPPKWYQAEF